MFREAVNEMRAGIFMGEAKQPPSSNRLHAALLLRSRVVNDVTGTSVRTECLVKLL